MYDAEFYLLCGNAPANRFYENGSNEIKHTNNEGGFNMKKKLWAVLLTGAMAAALLSGCGQAAETAPETQAAQEEGEAAAEEKETEEASGGGYDFVFVCPIVGMEYWNLCSDGIEKADAELEPIHRSSAPQIPLRSPQKLRITWNLLSRRSRMPSWHIPGWK